MKILFTSPVLEFPLAGGPALRIANSIKALNRISELHVLSRVNLYSIGGKNAEEYFNSICNRFDYLPSAKANVLKRIVKFRFRTGSSFLTNLYNFPLKVLFKLYRFLTIDEDITDSLYLVDYVKKNGIDVIWFGFGNISFNMMIKVKERLPEVKMVCDTDSVWSRFILRELETIKNETLRRQIEKKGKDKEIEEMEWVRIMDVTTAVSQVDAEYYKSLTTDKRKVQVFSNVVDLDMYSGNFSAPEGLKNPCIYLAGSFWERCPMEHASRWIINEVFPIVVGSIPNVHLYIIGNLSDIILGDISQPNITITGKLKSVLPYLCNADVSIVPLKFESGTRFKILEAGACGIPIVSTTLGAEGIPVSDGVDIIIADDPRDFAQAIIRLIKDKNLANLLSGNCKKLVQREYSIDALVEEGEKILKFLANK